MQNEEKKQQKLQKKSHEVLMKLLNNIGIMGSIIAAVADIVFVVMFVVGIKIDQDLSASIIFASVNAAIGLLISILLRYQGQKYAEIENEEICRQFHKKEIETKKKHLSMGMWQIVSGIRDLVFKCATTIFCISGVIYISITGSKNPIQILMTIATLLLFACFGLINMNSAYCRFYNIQLPMMEEKIKEKEIEKNALN